MLGLGAVVILSVLMCAHLLPDRVLLHVGEVCPVDIHASRSVTYEDVIATSQLKAMAEARVAPIYHTDEQAASDAHRSLIQVWGLIRGVRESGADQAVIQQRLSALLGSTVSSDDIRVLATFPPSNFDRIEAITVRLLANAMARPIRSNGNDLKVAIDRVGDQAQVLLRQPSHIKLVSDLCRLYLRPNRIYDPRLTQQKRDQVARSVTPVIGVIRQGEVVISRGQVVAPQDLEKLTALGLRNPRLQPKMILSITLMVAFMILVVGIYLARYHREIYRNPKQLLLLLLIVTGSVFGLKIGSSLLGVPLTGVQFGYLGMMSVVAAGMLITVLLNPSLAVVVCALLSAQSGLVMNHEIRFTVMTLVSSLVGIYSVARITDRVQLLRATALLAVTNVLMVWLLGGILSDTLHELETGTAWAISAALFAIAGFWFGVAVLEKPFDVLTSVWLLELSSSDRPLLKELCLRAPGTYAHSIMVGNLAESAAETIGADALFARVGAYYHDIGKMRRPQFFVENQHFENQHTGLAPTLSALIIESHVREGLEMARQHRLPRRIQQIIEEHHGTSLIRYFYHQALSDCGQKPGDPVFEQRFRYKGPRPSSRESGIIMLADTVEAAVRCLDKPEPVRINNLVQMLIQEKIDDEQLNECDLTFRDIEKIRQSFVRVLTAMLHGRIEYPTLTKPGASIDKPETRAALIENASLYSESSTQANQEIPASSISKSNTAC
ncbi:MAG: HDIG domain-containing protein [Armatimonadetes bacterium]|nr:HDIG domain-containing protein [Armatimonadota bacterium]